MQNLNQNSKIKGIEYRYHAIRAQIVLGEYCEPSELEVYLQFLQSLSKAMMAQASIMRNYKEFYKNALEGLERDLEENDREIDSVQKMLVQYKGFGG